MQLEDILTITPDSTPADGLLAPYAVHGEHSRGRRYAEPNTQPRAPFARDRDRIIHCVAFRRLEYKTQVFVNHENDLFRTRLTHTLEVAQIARTLARQLRLNEDLVEAIALGHDLGHTPFGHAGQEALNACMKDHGGFEHNLQSLKIIDELETRYAEFDGLNLSYETREGILKHCSRSHAKALGEIGQRFLLGQQASLEAQLVNLADEIAYSNHDIDDGLRSGLLKLDQLECLPLWLRHRQQISQRYPGLNQRRLISEVMRAMINAFILDLFAASTQAISKLNPANVDMVRAHHRPLIQLSEEMGAAAKQLKTFLFAELYRHHLVMRMNAKAGRIITRLFNTFMDDPRLLPSEYLVRSGRSQARAIAHYIAGMTDRYAIKEYQRLFSVSELSPSVLAYA
jgi:dGTPase